MEHIDDLLSTMDIPSTRRDTSKIENLRWLQRNLAINNADHPNFHATMREVNKLAQRG